MAEQGGIIIRTPERGTSIQCLSSTSLAPPHPHLPRTQVFHPASHYTIQNVRGCNHRFVSHTSLICSKMRLRAACDAAQANPPAAPIPATPGFHGRVRHCLEYEKVVLRGWGNEKLRTVNCRQHIYQQTPNNPNQPNPNPPCAVNCAIDHHRQYDITVNRLLRCPAPNDPIPPAHTPPFPIVAAPVICNKDHSAAGAFRGILTNYIARHGARYLWNLSPWYNQANPYQPPAWPPNLR